MNTLGPGLIVAGCALVLAAIISRWSLHEREAPSSEDGDGNPREQTQEPSDELEPRNEGQSYVARAVEGPRHEPRKARLDCNSLLRSRLRSGSLYDDQQPWPMPSAVGSVRHHTLRPMPSICGFDGT